MESDGNTDPMTSSHQLSLFLYFLEIFCKISQIEPGNSLNLKGVVQSGFFAALHQDLR